MFHNNKLSNNLKETIDSVHKKIKEYGLDPFTTIFEPLSSEQLYKIAAFDGFPNRYPHWRWGMEYDKITKFHKYGLTKIYEMVINNDPCYAYLLNSNSLATQKTVIAHVYAHSDFFKNNLWFKHTHKNMINKLADNANYIKSIIDELGHEIVENYIDICISIENLIDINHINNFTHIESNNTKPSNKNAQINNKLYLEKYTNNKIKISTPKNKIDKFQPTKDIIKFLIDNASLNEWQKNILTIIREEAYYFAPQKQTKILNEGWATYWHSEMMTKIIPLAATDIIDYCDQYSSIVQNNQGQLNPYRLGLNLLRHIKKRWDKGQFGLEYYNCDDYKTKKSWDTKAGKGLEKIFEVRKIHNDLTFIDEFLDEDFCQEHKINIEPKQQNLYTSN